MKNAAEQGAEQGYSAEQVMLTLAFISYASICMTGPARRDAGKLFAEIGCWLDTLDPVKDKWKIVWGPAVFKFPLTIFNDNVMFVVRNRQDEHEYCVVIRGTNPLSISNWLVEDFWVGSMRPWPHGESSGNPKISVGTLSGLMILQTLSPPRDLPGGGQDLMEFFEGVLASTDGEIRIPVTGHSLGGLLASTVSLWLTDTQKTGWDPEQRARLSVYSFAAPTAGNADFARHSNKDIGPVCSRLTQSLDVAPRFWNEQTMADIPTIYEPDISPSKAVLLALKLAERLVEGLGYTQIETGHQREGHLLDMEESRFEEFLQLQKAMRAQPLEGERKELLQGLLKEHVEDLVSFVIQAAAQHSIGYVDVWGLSGVLDFVKIALGKCSQ